MYTAHTQVNRPNYVIINGMRVSAADARAYDRK